MFKFKVYACTSYAVAAAPSRSTGNHTASARAKVYKLFPQHLVQWHNNEALKLKMLKSNAYSTSHFTILGTPYRLTENKLAVLQWVKLYSLHTGMVKCTLVQALRLCTGRTAHRGSRGRALLFHGHDTRRGWGSASRPGCSLSPGKTQ